MEPEQTLSAWQQQYQSTLSTCIREGTAILKIIEEDKASRNERYYKQLQELLTTFMKTGDSAVTLIEQQPDNEPLKDLLKKTKEVLQNFQSELQIVQLNL